jgi:hypothetical protein
MLIINDQNLTSNDSAAYTPIKVFNGLLIVLLIFILKKEIFLTAMRVRDVQMQISSDPVPCNPAVDNTNSKFPFQDRLRPVANYSATWP